MPKSSRKSILLPNMQTMDFMFSIVLKEGLVADQTIQTSVKPLKLFCPSSLNSLASLKPQWAGDSSGTRTRGLQRDRLT